MPSVARDLSRIVSKLRGCHQSTWHGSMRGQSRGSKQETVFLGETVWTSLFGEAPLRTYVPTATWAAFSLCKPFCHVINVPPMTTTLAPNKRPCNGHLAVSRARPQDSSVRGAKQVANESRCESEEERGRIRSHYDGNIPDGTPWCA